MYNRVPSLFYFRQLFTVLVISTKVLPHCGNPSLGVHQREKGRTDIICYATYIILGAPKVMHNWPNQGLNIWDWPRFKNPSKWLAILSIRCSKLRWCFFFFSLAWVQHASCSHLHRRGSVFFEEMECTLKCLWTDLRVCSTHMESRNKKLPLKGLCLRDPEVLSYIQCRIYHSDFRCIFIICVSVLLRFTLQEQQ